jgi:glycosyltransferase involved in cell wall biosynthesis
MVRPNWVQRVNTQNKNRFENRILCVGRLCYQKNFEYIIKEFRNTEGILTFDFVGSGEELIKLKESARVNGVSVNFLNQMSHSDLMDLYPKYKFFITSSLFEGHPKSLLEALASGCVVFASDIVSHREIIEDNETGFIFQLNDGSLRELFMKVRDNYNLINKISINGKRSMNDHYSLEKLVNQTYKDYKSLI